MPPGLARATTFLASQGTDMEPFQPSLFVPQVRRPVEAPPFVHQVETSRQAAVAIRPALSTQRGRVLAFIEARGDSGATDQEIEFGALMSSSSVRPRRGELLEAGLIRDSGITRPTKAGVQATVWRCA